MQLQGRVGIKCDICGLEVSTDFEYYSLDATRVQINRGITHKGERPEVSLDSCQNCMHRVCDLVKAKYKPVRGGINCDLTGATMTGTFQYFVVAVAKATVTSSNQPLECRTCRKQIPANSKQCTCGSADLRQIVLVDADKDFLELTVSENAFKLLRENKL